MKYTASLISFLHAGDLLLCLMPEGTYRNQIFFCKLKKFIFLRLLSSQIFQRMNVSRSIFARTIFDLLSFVWSCISCHELPNTTLLTGFKFTSVFITNFRIYFIFIDFFSIRTKLWRQEKFLLETDFFNYRFWLVLSFTCSTYYEGWTF